MQQQDLAEAIGVSRQTLSLIEAGETVPSTQIALALARELRCRVEDLFTLHSDGQVIDAELVGEPDLGPKDARKKRVSLGWVADRWVAHVLETDEALALGTPADGESRACRRRRARRGRRFGPCATWIRFSAIFSSPAAIRPSACSGATWKNASTVPACTGSRRPAGPRSKNWQRSASTSPGCTF